MKGKIFIKAVRHLLDPIDKKTPRRPWDVKFSTLDGKIINGRIICTSSNFKNDTFNFKFPESGEIRTVHSHLLLSLNNNEIML